MACLTIDEARRIVADFEKYVGLLTSDYTVYDLLITPCNHMERMQFIIDFRDKKDVHMDSSKGCDIIVGLRSPIGSFLDVPIRDFCLNYDIPYSFPG